MALPLGPDGVCESICSNLSFQPNPGRWRLQHTILVNKLFMHDITKVMAMCTFWQNHEWNQFVQGFGQKCFAATKSSTLVNTRSDRPTRLWWYHVCSDGADFDNFCMKPFHLWVQKRRPNTRCDCFRPALKDFRPTMLTRHTPKSPAIWCGGNSGESCEFANRSNFLSYFTSKNMRFMRSMGRMVQEYANINYAFVCLRIKVWPGPPKSDLSNLPMAWGNCDGDVSKKWMESHDFLVEFPFWDLLSTTRGPCFSQMFKPILLLVPQSPMVTARCFPFWSGHTLGFPPCWDKLHFLMKKQRVLV